MLRRSWFYCNGKWSPLCDVRRDLGLWRGISVFEALETRGGVLFHWDDHYRRLLNSCGVAMIPAVRLPNEKELLLKIRNILEYQNGERVVKILVTAGDSENHWLSSGEPNVLIDTFALNTTPKLAQRLRVEDGIRDFPTAKCTGLYQKTWILQRMAKQFGYDDFIFNDRSVGLTEASLANLFLVTHDKKLLTPTRGILFGVTRKIVLELAEKSGLFKKIREVDTFRLSRLSKCSEAFLTSTTLWITPIEKIDHFCFSAPYALTQKLRELFIEYREKYYKERGA